MSTTPPNPADSGSSSRDSGGSRILRGSLASALAQVLYLVTRFALTPYVVAKAGFEAYGFWSLLFLTLGFLGVNRMGFLSACVSYVARYTAEGRQDRAQAFLRTSSTMALLFALVVGGALCAAAPWVVRLIGCDGAMEATAVLTLRITAVATFASLVLGGYQSALEGLQQYPRVKAVDVLANLVEAALIVAFLGLDMGLIGLAVAYAARLFVPIPLAAMYARRLLPGLNALPGPLDRECAKELLRFGGSVQATGAMYLAIVAIDRLALAHLASLAVAGVYEVARKLAGFATMLPGPAVAPLVPAAADMRAKEGADLSRLRQMQRSATRVVALLTAIPLVCFLFVAEILVFAWLGQDQPQVALALRFMTVSTYLHVATAPATSVLRGLARPKAEVTYVSVWLALGLVFIPVGAYYGGLPGAAASSAAVASAACLLLLAIALPSLGLSRRTLLRDLGGPLLCALVPGLAVLSASQLLGDGLTRIDAALFTVVSGGFVAFIASVGAYQLVFDDAEREFLSGKVRALRSRLRPPRPEPAEQA